MCVLTCMIARFRWCTPSASEASQADYLVDFDPAESSLMMSTR
jgi:hypothetical protein